MTEQKSDGKKSGTAEPTTFYRLLQVPYYSKQPLKLFHSILNEVQGWCTIKILLACSSSYIE